MTTTTFKDAAHRADRVIRRPGRPGQFFKDDAGSMTIFGMFMLMCMMVMVGIGVDAMRHERERAHLQYTLDRAVLAAADLDQPLSPQAVVEDYFAKAGLSDALSNVQVTDTLGSRTVSATAESTLPTFFMRMTGVDDLAVATASTAQENIDAVEISLVLDVSGSMNRHSRLSNLKVAAKDFVDEMFDNSVPGTITISIVPYATQVSVPEELFDELNVSEEHNFSRCINWAADEFNTTTISTTEAYQRTMHFDPWNDFDGRDNGSSGELVHDPICEAEASREILLLEDDRTTLKTFIDNLFADGNTSLDVGMKWGSILVDPTFRPIVQALAHPDVGLIDPSYANRPVAHTDAETIKVVVLMTDGQNTNQYYIEDGFREGPSNIWWNAEEEEYSVYDPPSDRYFVPHRDAWADQPYGNGSDTVCDWRLDGFYWSYGCETEEQPGSAVQLSYPDLWAYTSMEWIVEDLYEPWMNDDLAWSRWYHDVQSSYGRSVKNTRTTNICGASKDNGTVVFTIGFEAPDASETLLENCASSPSHYFDVEGLEISDAFSAIASSIRALRLTQ